MNKLVTVVAILFLAGGVSAQTAAVKDIPVDQSGTTTIKITKGETSTERNFDILSNTAEVIGEPEVLDKKARESWRAACNEWKKELRDLNKENQILAMTCGSPNCQKQGYGTVCKSNANFQLKVRIK